MIKHIELRNFKCFASLPIRTDRLTIIAGNNGAGKSSIIQSLLLLRQTYKDKILDLETQLRMNGDLVELGSANAIHSVFSDDAPTEIRIWDDMMDEDELCVIVEDSTSEEDVSRCKIEGDFSKAKEKMNLLNDDFVYLYADRITPQSSYLKSVTSLTDSRIGDRQGHLAPYRLFEALAKGGKCVVPSENLRMNGEIVATNVSAWIAHIMGTINLNVVAEDKDPQTVKLRYESIFNGRPLSSTPMNMAFGYSYLLPIVVGLLTAPKGSLFIVENPEAHLHPSAQLKLGGMIAKAAEAGIQVFLETHSDHLLNGIRIAAHDHVLEANKVAIHFIYIDESNHHRSQEIRLDQDGTLNNWPEGFFNEWENALKSLF